MGSLFPSSTRCEFIWIRASDGVNCRLSAPNLSNVEVYLYKFRTGVSGQCVAWEPPTGPLQRQALGDLGRTIRVRVLYKLWRILQLLIYSGLVLGPFPQREVCCWARRRSKILIRYCEPRRSSLHVHHWPSFNFVLVGGVNTDNR